MNIRFFIVMGGLALLLMSLAAISSVAESGASRGEKARWVLIVALLPLLGWAFWWFKGPRRA
ncbi:PLDc N-terminal domain-containing protein [Halopseudomonas pertucinogena]|uniref:Cardiolipin synthase N-terminal domain-containing protein n=1 Tax=Halopseudomonas pertucinogena TaxID=86175 RepID=A0ABQ2CLB0_9GAMM|nr:PLDc N-terminal domain-containing protein [Halopseudomonas pertucinogena]GGI94503.1 hypothetical protein GCM10009083_08850 [Halopseudomonas pertucinogena]